MHVLHASAKDDPSRLVYEEVPRPEPDASDVLVRVHASGVTPSELSWPTTWLNPDGTLRALPIIPGHEVAGEVVETGAGADGLAIGDRVFGLIDFQRDGADAEYVVARASELALLPEALTFTDAAAVPLSALTAWQALFDQAALAAGERILIHGAAGGVGTFAVQFARWRGAHVIASASAAAASLLRELGADEVIDYHSQRFEEGVGTVDVVFDTVGGETWERSRSVLNPGGRLVSVAVPKPPDLEMPAGTRALWFVVAPRRDQLTEIADLIMVGHVRPIVSEVRPLSAAREAFGMGHHSPGKIVLQVQADDR